MLIAIFGLAISGDDLVAIVLAVLLATYLIYALIKPEHF